MRLINRLLCQSSNPISYFITTPIFYVNGDPHIGHLYTLLVADALHRFRQLKGARDTIFSTGTDEHGLKIQRAAESSNMRPLEFCNEISQKFRNLCHTFDITFTHFIRTTDQSHKEAVQHFWNTLSEKGFIYKSSYEGWYSVPDETFVGSSEIEEKIVNGKTMKVFSQSGHILEWFKEENYMFKLSNMTDRLRHWVNSDSACIKPQSFHQYINNRLDKGLYDISVSRPRSRLDWGIPVPGDGTQRIYVWLDALVNYLTVAGHPKRLNFWPPDCQVIGKDIINFHAIFWPAFLIAAGLEPPKSIICHSHWTVEGLKMSKSVGNVVNPHDLVEPFTIDGVRYFFLRLAVPSSDADFSLADMKSYVNADLANTIGNCLSRVAAPTVNKKEIFPGTPSASELSSLPSFDEISQALNSLPAQVNRCFEDADFRHGIGHILESVRLVNRLLEEVKPWVLVKSDPEGSQLITTIYVALETLRVAAILLQPIVPSISAKILDKLEIPKDERSWSHAVPCLDEKFRKETKKLNPTRIIPFKRIK